MGVDCIEGLTELKQISEKEKKLWLLGGMFESRVLHTSGKEKE